MLDKITCNSTIRDLYCEVKKYNLSDLLFTYITDDVLEKSISYYDDEKCEIISSLKWIISKNPVVEKLYSHKQHPRMIYIKGQEDKPCIIVCAGGGYNRQWLMVEAYPTAKKFNEQGYNVCILIYTTGKPAIFNDAIDDLAKAVSYIKEKDYAVVGFSAGGHLVCSWGREDIGFGKYNLKKPIAIIAVYPATSLNCCLENAKTKQQIDSINNFIIKITGENFDKAQLDKYTLEGNITENYPPVYLIHSKDDTTVPVESSYVFESELKKHNITYKARYPLYGEHAFGVANNTDANGWIAEAIKFIENEGEY